METIVEIGSNDLILHSREPARGWGGYALAAALAATMGLLSLAAAQAQTRTPWQMHDGLEVTMGNPLGLLPFSCAPAQHGDPCEYDVASVPPQADPGWGPAPDGDIINFSIPSRVCSAPVTCQAYGDFTYFQTLVAVPSNATVTDFRITFSDMDDGSRVSIFNSTYPGGLVIPGSYVFLGGTGTSDLHSYVAAGEVNRVVVTQVDDCCSGNNLGRAEVVLDGQVVTTQCGDGTIDPPDEQCDDGNIVDGDCCSSSCQYEANGSPCMDGDPCTFNTCDGAGHCGQIPSGCKAAGNSLLMLTNDVVDDGNDKLIWKWRKGSGTSLPELGAPTDTAGYALCLYAGATSSTIRMPPGADWQPAGSKGYKFKDSTGTPNGAQKVVLKSGAAGKAKALVKARGANLPDELTGVLPLPVTVRLVNDRNGICFASIFTSTVKNDGTHFKAKAP